MDRFIPLDISSDKELELAKNKSLELFELVRSVVKNRAG